MKTRAKFICQHSKPDGEYVYWRFSAVYHKGDPDHENSKFTKYTPNGDLSMCVSREHYAGEHPVEGKEYYLDITEA